MPSPSQVQILQTLSRYVQQFVAFMTGDANTDVALDGGVAIPSLRKIVASYATFIAGAASPPVNIVVIGNSIGAAVTQAPNTTHIETYLKQMTPELANATTYNFAVPGCLLDATPYFGVAHSSDTKVQYTNSAAALAPSITGVPAYLFIHTVENDPTQINGAGDGTGATFCATLDALCTTARNAGFYVIVDTGIIRQDDPPNTMTPKALDVTYRINDFIRHMRSADAVVDDALLFPNPLDPTLFVVPLGVHPNDAGNKIKARSWKTAISSIGIATPAIAAALPDASYYVSTLTPADIAMLDAASVEGVTNNLANAQYAQFATNLPAPGAGDFTVAGFLYLPKTPGARADATLLSSSLSGGFEIGVQDISGATSGVYDGRLSAYIIPDVTPAIRIAGGITGRWCAYLITRAGGVITGYVDGKPNTYFSGAYATALAAANQIGIFGGTRIARVRYYNAAKTHADAARLFNTLNAFDPDDATCMYAMADGCQTRGLQIGDLTGNGHILRLTNAAGTAAAKLRCPGLRGVVRGSAQHGQQTAFFFTKGDRIRGFRFTTDAALTGTLNIGITDGGGEIYNGTPGASTTVDAPLGQGLVLAADAQLFIHCAPDAGSFTFVADLEAA